MWPDYPNTVPDSVPVKPSLPELEPPPIAAVPEETSILSYRLF